MNKEEKLKEHGWEVVCESPFNIEHEESGSVATIWAADAVYNDIMQEATISRLLLIKDAYKGALISGDRFIEEMIKSLEEHYQ